MIDLHSHFLFDIDDGADTKATTLEMLKQAKSVGIEYVLATPHVNEQLTASDERQIIDTFEEVKQLIKEENIDLEIGLAGEVDYNGDLFGWLDHSWILFGRNKKYLLFEIPMFNLPVNFQELLFQVTVKGITPVLAHPERNIHIQQKPHLLLEWINNGCLIQLNAGSILGRFGEACRRLSHKLIKANVVTLVSSDAHDLHKRDYTVMKEAFELVSGTYTPEVARMLFKTNAGKMLKGGEIPIVEIDTRALNLSISQRIFRKFRFVQSN
jgi:protein-tyrosine phosphatase